MSKADTYERLTRRTDLQRRAESGPQGIKYCNSYVAPRIRAAYKKMAKKARYRPYAPSDGLGNISLTDAELADPGRLEREAATAALIFDDDDKEHLHAVIGCVNGDSAAAMFYCLQAAEVCCTGSGELPIAIALLKLAIEELERTS